MEEGTRIGGMHLGNDPGPYPLSDVSVGVVAEPDGRRAHHFKDLWVWKASMQLLEPIYTVTRKLPKEEQYGLVSQLRRAAVSVPSNISEGWARNKKGYFLQGLSYARGSLHEMETQLLACVELEYLRPEEVQPILERIAGISSAILKLINSVEARP